MNWSDLDARAPVDVAEIVEAWEARQAREDLRFGTVCATIVNAVGGTKEPASPADFFASLDALRPPPRQITNEEFDNLVLNWKAS